MPYIRALFLALALAAAFIFVVPIQALSRHYGWKARGRIQKDFCRAMCAIIGVKIEPVGTLPEAERNLLVSNHVSWTDIIVLASFHPLVFLAKREVAQWPVLGFLARLQGTVFIKRSQLKDIPAINAELAAVMRGGDDLVVFAEGTSTPGVITPAFHSAHFEAAQLAAAAIVPVAILYAKDGRQADVGWYGDMTFLPHLWSLLRRSGVRCHVIFGAPIDVRGKDRKTLALEAQEQVRALLLETHNRLGVIAV